MFNLSIVIDENEELLLLLLVSPSSANPFMIQLLKQRTYSITKMIYR